MKSCLHFCWALLLLLVLSFRRRGANLRKANSRRVFRQVCCAGSFLPRFF